MAEEGSDGKMHATVRIPMDELVFDPGVLVLPHGGELELEIINDDNNSHCAVLPCNGDSKFIWLVNFSKERRPSSSTARATTGTAPGPETTRAVARPGRSSSGARSRTKPSSTARPSRGRRKE